MHKNIKIISLLLLLFPSLLFSGEAPPILWMKGYGTGSQEIGESVVKTADGGFAVAGYRYTFGSGKREQVFIVRTDANGDSLWTREFGGEKDDQAFSIDKTDDGGLIIAGMTRSMGAGNHDLYIIRADSNGDTIWTKTYGFLNNDQANSVRCTRDGGFIAAGWTTDSTSAYHIYIVRTDSLGDSLWTKIYDLDGRNPMAHSITQTSDGGFAVTGNDAGHRYNWAFLMRLDSLGDTLWTKCYQRMALGKSVQQTNDDGFIITGWADPDTGIPVIRTDSFGDTLWTRIYPSTDDIGLGHSITNVRDGGYAFTGNHIGAMVIYRINEDGDILWFKKIERQGGNQGNSIKQTSDGGYIVAGSGAVSDSVGTGPDLFMVRLAPDGTEIKNGKPEASFKQKKYSLSYDLKGRSVNITFTMPTSANVSLVVYDSQGREVKVLVDKYLDKGSHTIKWNTKRDRRKAAAGGVYFLKLSANGHTVFKKVTIVR